MGHKNLSKGGIFFFCLDVPLIMDVTSLRQRLLGSLNATSMKSFFPN